MPVEAEACAWTGDSHREDRGFAGLASGHRRFTRTNSKQTMGKQRESGKIVDCDCCLWIWADAADEIGCCVFLRNEFSRAICRE